MKQNSPLQKELDHQRFLHAIQYVRNESTGIKKLSTAELARINQFLCGKTHDLSFDPWRFEPVDILIPSGKTLQMNVITNPMIRAREIIGYALQSSGNQQAVEGACYLYSNLVLGHFFKSANRRTAVAASLWILIASGFECDAEEFLEIPIGDLRQSSDLQSLKTKIENIVQDAQ